MSVGSQALDTTTDMNVSFAALRTAQRCIGVGRAQLRAADLHLTVSRTWLAASAMDVGPVPLRTSSADRRRQVDVIAAAFELTPREVMADALVVSTGGSSHAPLQRWFQHRHGWDGSMAPYYLAQLRHLLPLSETAHREAR